MLPLPFRALCPDQIATYYKTSPNWKLWITCSFVAELLPDFQWWCFLQLTQPSLQLLVLLIHASPLEPNVFHLLNYICARLILVWLFYSSCLSTPMVLPQLVRLNTHHSRHVSITFPDSWFSGKAENSAPIPSHCVSKNWPSLVSPPSITMRPLLLVDFPQ